MDVTRNHLIKLITVQIQYSLLDQRPVYSGLVDLCEERGIKILPYGVLAGGFLTDTWLGKPHPDPSVSYCLKRGREGGREGGREEEEEEEEGRKEGGWGREGEREKEGGMEQEVINCMYVSIIHCTCKYM